MSHADQQLIEMLLNLVTNGALDRIDSRAERAAELRQWGLHPHRPDLGSPLAGDDCAFQEAYPLLIAGDAAVTEECLFPMMNATENLFAASLLVRERKATRNLYASSIMQLCRSAMETSARTIWMLSPPDRRERLDRCLSMEMEQLRHQSKFLELEGQFERVARNPRPPHIVAMNNAHRAKHAALVSRSNAEYRPKRPPSFTETIALAAQWVDGHLPAHDTGELAVNGLEQGSRVFYSYGSSFVHGYSWMTDYARGEKLFGFVADGLAAALHMTECAVCLYEAICRRPGGERGAESLVCERLEPTILQWASLFV